MRTNPRSAPHTSECRAYSPEHGAECLLRVGHAGPHANWPAVWKTAPGPWTVRPAIVLGDDGPPPETRVIPIADGDGIPAAYVPDDDDPTRLCGAPAAALLAAAPALRDALAAIVACYPRVREESSPIEHARALLATIGGAR